MDNSIFDTLQNFDSFPVLYSRTATGAIQTWKVQVDGNKYRFITGQKDSPNKIFSEWTVCVGKNIGRTNETTGAEQALKEAKSAQAKKLKSEGYWLNIEDIDKVQFVEPMLAYKLKDHIKNIRYPVMVDKKYNGGRVIATREGLKTRKGESYITLPHIWAELKHLFDMFPDLVLDGEGYNHELRFQLNELMKILRLKKEANITTDILKKSRDLVKYYIYDGYNFTVRGVKITVETGCLERRKALFQLFEYIPHCIPVEFQLVSSEEELFRVNNSNIEEGYEGSIIRTIDAPYQHKRTKDLLKVKPMDDAEFQIMNIEAGIGNWSGKAKRIYFKDKDGKVFCGTFKGTMAQAAKFLQEKNRWIGQTVTVNYFGLTGLGTPNYAQLDINNCLKS